MKEIKKSTIEQEAESLGLFLLGVVSLELGEDFKRYEKWIDEKQYSGMEYLSKHRAIRQDPKALLPSAKNAWVLALPYYLGDKVGKQVPGDKPLVAQYARFRDYHRTFRELGEKLVQNLQKTWGFDFEYRVLVDSAPLLERALARKSPKGFIGKNTCYIHPEKGSFLLLGEVLSSLDLDLDTNQESEGCGSCTSCQVACPTGALNKDYVLDARLCIAYWTIEHRGTIPFEFWGAVSHYVFGCDICQLVCPFNQGRRPSPIPGVIDVKEFPSLFEMATMDQSDYERFFGGTPMTRAKRNGLRRNALIAMAVKNDPQLQEAIRRCESDLSYPIAETLVQVREFLSGAHFDKVALN